MVWPVLPWRKPDWAESDAVKEYIEMSQEYVFKNPTKEAFSNSGQVLTEWYIQRAIAIEAESGQIEFAIDLLKLGNSYNIKGLDSTLDKFVNLAFLAYQCSLKNAALTFE